MTPPLGGRLGRGVSSAAVASGDFGLKPADEGRADVGLGDRQHVAALDEFEVERRDRAFHRLAVDAPVEDVVLASEEDADRDCRAWRSARASPRSPGRETPPTVRSR